MPGRRVIVHAGFHKTGTTSLYAALTTLGFKVTGTVAHKWSAEQLASEGAQYCIDVMRKFDACEDMPWPHFFKELDAAYPGSKFILTLRDYESWHRSIDAHFGDQQTEHNAFAYGRDKASARDHKAHWIATHQRHVEAVRHYFSERPADILEMTLAAGDGWERLCPFLGVNQPAGEPFPVKNAAAGRKSFAYRAKRQLWRLAGLTPHPERLL